MFRITNRMMYNNTLINAFRHNQGMLNAQEQISSGKRINRPSDDPVGMMEVLSFRTHIGRQEQYLGVMENAESTLGMADTVLGGVHDQLKKAKELSLQQVGGLANADTRRTAAATVDNMIEQMISYGNTKVAGRYLFAGQSTQTPAVDADGAYRGSGKDIMAEITENVVISISVKASDFLTADLNPAVSASTQLSSLNAGQGFPAGQFTITDRAGGVAVIDTSAMTTVGEVLTAINTNPGINVTASISADSTSLTLQDNNATPTQALSISDSDASGTAQALGIVGSRNLSVFTGLDIDPAIDDATLVSDLYAGTGMTLDSITISSGSASATVTFSAGTLTMGQVRTAINSAGASIGVTAGYDPTARRMTLTATGGGAAFATEAGLGNSAAFLGLGGGQNIIPTLQLFSTALKANDSAGIQRAMELLDSNMDTAVSLRGAVGARVNQVTATGHALDQSRVENVRLKSQVEDADYLAAISEMSMLQTAYQATLKSSASIIQPTLMNFIG